MCLDSNAMENNEEPASLAAAESDVKQMPDICIYLYIYSFVIKKMCVSNLIIRPP